jgi:hypothetical protein
MNVETLSKFLLWCAIVNYAILIIWFVVFVFARERVYEIHGKWYPISPGQFNAVNYAGAAIYKILILVFNLVPYIALQIIA